MIRTGSDGQYRFDKLPAGAQQGYAVRVEAPGFGYRQIGSRMPPSLPLLESGSTEHWT